MAGQKACLGTRPTQLGRPGPTVTRIRLRPGRCSGSPLPSSPLASDAPLPAPRPRQTTPHAHSAPSEMATSSPSLPVGSRAALATRLPAMVASGRRQPPVRLDFLSSNRHMTDQVRWLGRLSREDLLREYGAADIFVFPSRYEGFGIYLAGIPILSSSAVSATTSSRSTGLFMEPPGVRVLTNAGGGTRRRFRHRRYPARPDRPIGHAPSHHEQTANLHRLSKSTRACRSRTIIRGTSPISTNSSRQLLATARERLGKNRRWPQERITRRMPFHAMRESVSAYAIRVISGDTVGVRGRRTGNW